MVLRYIHQNPVKAGIAKNAGKYLWSSYHNYVGIPGITDIELALENFSSDKAAATKLFIEYTNENNVDECLGCREKVIVSDQKIMKYLSEIGITTISQLQRLNKEQRDNVIRKIKEKDGITIRQLARITGISKSVIDRL